MENELNDLVIPDFELPEIDVVDIVETPEEEVSEEKQEETSQSEVESDAKAIAFYEELKSRGYVNEENEFKGTWEELDQYFDTLPQQVLNSVVESLPQESKDILKFIATAGQNINKQELKQFFETYFEEQTEKETSIETNEDARQFLNNHYKTLGMKEKAITTILDQMEDDEEILEEAKKIFEQKTKDSKVQAAIEAKENQNKQLTEQYKERARLIQEELQQVGWKKEKVERVAELLSNQNLNTRLIEVFGNPKTLVQLADFLDLYDPKTKQFDLTAYKNQSLSTATKTLKERLEKENFSSASVSTKHRDANPIEKDDLVPVFD